MTKRHHSPKQNAKGGQVEAMEFPTRITLPSNFPELSQTFLDEEKFFSQVVPAFEKARDGLVEIVAKDKELAAKIASTWLIILDNRNTENKMYFWLSHDYENNFYLLDQHHGLHDYHGFSSTSINLLQGIHANTYNALRSLFVQELLARAKPDDIAFHMERRLGLNYKTVDRIDHKDYFLLRVINYKFSDELFSMSAYRLDLVIPIADELDASDILDETWGNQKIILTTKLDTSGYKGFDCIVGEKNWHSNFSFLRFSCDLEFYKRLVQLDDLKLYAAIEYLTTSTHLDTFALKKELISVPPSDGKRFEACLQKVLTECFQPSYSYFDLKPQVGNRGKTKIRDYIIRNHNSTNSFLNFLEYKGVELLLFDAKNYKNPLKSEDISMFQTYISDNRMFGNFGVLLARNGISKNCEETIFRDFNSKGVIILILNQSDLLLMLDRNEQGRKAADVLSEKYSEFIKQA